MRVGFQVSPENTIDMQREIQSLISILDKCTKYLQGCHLFMVQVNLVSHSSVYWNPRIHILIIKFLTEPTINYLIITVTITIARVCNLIMLSLQVILQL